MLNPNGPIGRRILAQQAQRYTDAAQRALDEGRVNTAARFLEMAALKRAGRI